MNLYHFATQAADEDLHLWFNTENTTRQQFEMLHGLILWDKPDHVCRNCMSYDEARMLMCFVALATGEELPVEYQDPILECA